MFNIDDNAPLWIFAIFWNALHKRKSGLLPRFLPQHKSPWFQIPSIYVHTCISNLRVLIQKTFAQHLYNVGPGPSTLVQHCSNDIHMVCVYWIYNIIMFKLYVDRHIAAPGITTWSLVYTWLTT